MTPAVKDIENRRPVWLALSELFLDTEMQPFTHSYIARTISESPYSLRDADKILFREVYPACIVNFHGVTGEWAGFREDWLESRIIHYVERSWCIARYIQPRRWMIRDDWNRVKELVVGNLEVQQP
jgi:hypothetical protein